MRKAPSFVPIALLALAAPVAAQPRTGPAGDAGEPDEILVNVPYGDLQLTREVDRLVLASRVRRASHRACVDIYSSWYDSAGMLCEHIAWQVAKPQIDRAIADAGTVKMASSKTITFSLGR